MPRKVGCQPKREECEDCSDRRACRVNVAMLQLMSTIDATCTVDDPKSGTFPAHCTCYPDEAFRTCIQHAVLVVTGVANAFAEAFGTQPAALLRLCEDYAETNPFVADSDSDSEASATQGGSEPPPSMDN